MYINAKDLGITKQVELIDKKKYVKVVLDKEFKTFMIYILALQTLQMTIFPPKTT